MHSFLNKRHWLPGSNSVTPSTSVTKENRLGPKPESTMNSNSNSNKISHSTSSVRNLIPSLSTFNLPPSTTKTTMSPCIDTISDLYSPCSSGNTTAADARHDFEPSKPVYETPPPNFACDLQTTYPTTLDQYRSDDLQQQHGIQPVKLLMERLEAWQYVTKCLYDHFEALALVESSIVKSYQKLEGTLEFEQHPTNDTNGGTHHSQPHSGVGLGGGGSTKGSVIISSSKESHQHPHTNNSSSIRDYRNGIKASGRKKSTPHALSYSTIHYHFAKNGGIRQVCDAWQMYHLKSAKDHTDFASFIRAQGLPLLANIKNELKYIVRSVRSDDRLSLTQLAKLKEEAAKRLTRLDQQLTFFDHHPDHGDTKEDPWLINTRVIKQMIKVYQQENKMHETVIRLQREIMALEKQLMEDLRQFCQQLYNLRESSWLGVDRGLQAIIRTFDNVANDADWMAFVDQCKNQLVSEDASYRHPDKLHYPNHSHSLVQPLFAARMERKSSVLQNWHEYIYVLTPAGFLHEYRNQKSYPSYPTSTVFVPEYNISTLSTNRHHDLVFQLQPYALAPTFPRLTSTHSISGGKHSSSNTTSIRRHSTQFRRGSTRKSNITLRAKCAQDMQIWLEHLTVCSHRYRPAILSYRHSSSVGDLISSAGTFSPTLVNQDIASPRWLLSPAPTSRTTASTTFNNSTSMVTGLDLPPISEAPLDEPVDQKTSPPETSSGLSVLADFLSFASKQLATDQQTVEGGSDAPTSQPPPPEEPPIIDSAQEDEPSSSILTGVKYPPSESS